MKYRKITQELHWSYMTTTDTASLDETNSSFQTFDSSVAFDFASTFVALKGHSF